MSIFSKIKEKARSTQLKTKAIAGGFILTIASIAALATMSGAAASPVSTPNCDANAVVTGGASSVSALQSKYTNGATCTSDGVTYKTPAYSIQDIYHGFDISPSDISAMSTEDVTGYVTNTGDVYAGNTLVATGAMTAGRQIIYKNGKEVSGQTSHHYGQTTYIERAPSISFSTMN